ncbi:caspase-6-like [Chanos chanos]|uniref:Caspase-6 n=1 Tax=Chanos chanos TaxID=29144 RepID=A0A6J2WII7_CHACN|nr:caspase-6-like [Chanos chanos]
MASTDGTKAALSENVTEVDAVYSSSSSLDPAEEYCVNNKRRGLALIFNQQEFFFELRLSYRGGSNTDRLNLIERFKELQFDVKDYTNLRKEDMFKILSEAAAANHVDADCFVCVFLSHGEKDYIYAYDERVPVQDITDLFKGTKCPSLVGKPKIFILQACRGDVHDDPVKPMDVVDCDSEMINEVVVDAGALYTLPAGADFLMCYSVAEGYYSHRETVNGSWYIQDLCEALRKYGTSLEFVELLTLVNRKVSRRSVGNCRDREAIGKKQVPCFTSMLTKKLYLRPKRK